MGRRGIEREKRAWQQIKKRACGEKYTYDQGGTNANNSLLM